MRYPSLPVAWFFRMRAVPELGAANLSRRQVILRYQFRSLRCPLEPLPQI